MYGTQAQLEEQLAKEKFENDVKMYGTQAAPEVTPRPVRFENDVKMYGTQAYLFSDRK